MTYSVELFICMIVGLVIGHGIFNTGHDFSKLTLLFIKYIKCNSLSAIVGKGNFMTTLGLTSHHFACLCIALKF